MVVNKEYCGNRLAITNRSQMDWPVCGLPPHTGLHFDPTRDVAWSEKGLVDLKLIPACRKCRTVAVGHHSLACTVGRYPEATMHDWSPPLSPTQATEYEDKFRNMYPAAVQTGVKKFDTGAQRSAVNTDYSQFSHVAARLHAETQAEGNEKYGYGNWQKGIPVSNLLSHTLAHIFALMNGATDENHLGHAIWGLDKVAHFIETRPDLVDIPSMRKARKLDETEG